MNNISWFSSKVFIIELYLYRNTVSVLKKKKKNKSITDHSIHLIQMSYVCENTVLAWSLKAFFMNEHFFNEHFFLDGWLLGKFKAF